MAEQERRQARGLSIAFGAGLLVMVLVAAVAEAQEAPPPDPLKAQAQAFLQGEVGVWDSTWEYLGEDGKVAGTLEGTETFETMMDGSVLLLTSETPKVQGQSKAFLFYNPIAKKIYLTSVDKRGDFWLLTREVGSHVLVSEPHVWPDGRRQIIRFTTTRETENEKDILMEYSFDEGETWTKGFRQQMKRRGAAPAAAQEEAPETPAEASSPH